jgi:stalled ribosome rescue protein Dom34
VTTAHHTLVWIDHQEAKIFNFTETEDEHLVVRSAHPHQHLHHKAHAQGSGHVPVETPFLKRVAEAIAATTSLVICGPSNARHELASFIRKTDPRLAIAIRAVEPLDHPSDGELLKLGRQFFRPAERLQAMLRG